LFRMQIGNFPFAAIGGISRFMRLPGR